MHEVARLSQGHCTVFSPNYIYGLGISNMVGDPLQQDERRTGSKLGEHNGDLCVPMHDFDICFRLVS